MGKSEPSSSSFAMNHHHDNPVKLEPMVDQRNHQPAHHHQPPSLSLTGQPSSSSSAGTAAGKVSQRKHFREDELRQALMPTLEKLYKQDPESMPFQKPVDPTALEIPVSIIFPPSVEKSMSVCMSLFPSIPGLFRDHQTPHGFIYDQAQTGHGTIQRTVAVH